MGFAITVLPLLSAHFSRYPIWPGLRWDHLLSSPYVRQRQKGSRTNTLAAADALLGRTRDGQGDAPCPSPRVTCRRNASTAVPGIG